MVDPTEKFGKELEFGAEGRYTTAVKLVAPPQPMRTIENVAVAMAKLESARKLTRSNTPRIREELG